MEDNTKYTLITNISFVNLQKPVSMRLECHALLIEEGAEGGFGQTYNRLRAFSADGALPIFTYWLPDGEIHYTLQNAEDRSKIFLGSDGPKPIFLGSLMAIGDLELFIQIEDYNKELDVYKQTGDICKIWDVLKRKCAEYWKAPAMPIASFHAPSSVLTQCAIETAPGVQRICKEIGVAVLFDRRIWY